MTGTVVALYRYPVKSFQGIAVDSLSIGRRGVHGDRRFALVDTTSDRILSAKAEAALLLADASEAPDGSVTLRLPNGREVRTDEPSIHEVLSAWAGRPVRLVEADNNDEPLTDDSRSLSYEMTFEPEHDDAERVPIPSPAGTFLDLAAVHVLTTGSLARCREQQPGTDWDVRRFRPNVLVEIDDGGFPEDGWVDSRLRVGETVLAVEQRTVRCAMPLRAQPGGIARDVEVHRAMAAIHANHLGVYCAVTEPGVVRVGDAVDLLA